MNRRQFLTRVLGGVTAATVVPFLPVRRALAFRRDAFQIGISQRYVSSYHVVDASRVTRLDCLYGIGTFSEPYVVPTQPLLNRAC